MHRRAGLVVLLTLGLGACAAAPAGTARDSTAPAPALSTATSTGSTSDDVVSFVVVGDSITAGTEPIEGSQVPGRRSWLPAAQGAPLEFRGGWAVPGATTAEMRAGVVPAAADVVVVLAGTNDIYLGSPWESTRDNLLAIVDTVGVDSVLLSLIPPIERIPASRNDYNQRLRALAEEQGWHLVDPWTAVDRDGAWLPGASADGVHPTQATADAAGRGIRAAVLDVAGG